MKSPISLLILLAATVAFADSPEAIQRVTLDERVVAHRAGGDQPRHDYQLPRPNRGD